MPRFKRERCDAAHESAADAEDMYVHSVIVEKLVCTLSS
jgi:hypothetical protein